jgi:hypothetical protein
MEEKFLVAGMGGAFYKVSVFLLNPPLVPKERALNSIFIEVKWALFPGNIASDNITKQKSFPLYLPFNSFCCLE